MSNEFKTEDANPEKVNQPDGAPIAPSLNKAAVSRETLSHQWQKDSPAINTNAQAGYASENDSILDKVDTEENLKKRADAEEVKKQQLDARLGTDYDCSLLDVSDVRYCNPGSERHRTYLDSKGVKHNY